MTTGWTEPGPSEANWFLAKKAGEGDTVTLEPSGLKKTDDSNHSWISPRHLPEARVRRETVFRVKYFKSIDLRGSKGFLLSDRRPRERGPKRG